MTGYHITEQKNIKKFDISRVGSGMGTSFYGYGLYFALDKATCEQYYKQFPDDRDYLIYKVSIDSRKIFNEDDKMLNSSMSVLEQYAQLVEEFGSEEAASKKIAEESKQLNANNIAQQQVQQAMQPIQSLDKMQTTEQQSLQQNSKEMTVQLEQKEEGNQQMSEDQLKKTEQLISMMNVFMPQVLQKLDEPQATPVFVPYQVDSTKNSANMAYN